ncbi:GNAT family N-acetyltransferase [Thalassobacillus pellis]|uniref:GNAT family N-acetyltransferase n=1 Tax=Thalassobacillus pellis TaxID=748008 RepID=UPI00195F3423
MKREITFRKVDYEKDLRRIYQWMHEEHVIPFWHLDFPFQRFSRHLEKALADQHQTLYIGEVDGTAMSYWESYWVNGDIVQEYYDAAPYDQGVHLLIGDTAFLGKGYALPLLRSMVDYQFSNADTEKVIAEPDIRNEKMIHVFKKCGFEPVKPIQLPDKTGLLMFCDRTTFEKRWAHANCCQNV